MATTPLALDGYTDLPPGKIASVVTFLGMRARPAPRAEAPGAEAFRLERLTGAWSGLYRKVFSTLGERWMWFSRTEMPDVELKALLDDPRIEAYALIGPDGPCGLLDLDFREAGACEIVFFGVYDALVGKGAARWLMNRGLEKAWRDGVGHVWLHTCHFDHPKALDFYRRSGFSPWKLAIEVVDDPRLSGHMRRDAAPHIPLIEA
jgi:GNAT superfamily N-acetyltransferase